MDFIFQKVWFVIALATVVYIACLKTGENKTQTDIANAADITEVILRKRYIDLKINLLS
jgi:transcription initiation factor TFIIB